LTEMGYGDGNEARIVGLLKVTSSDANRDPSAMNWVSVPSEYVTSATETGIVTLTVRRNLLKLGG
jgi:hypothetical protein